MSVSIKFDGFHNTNYPIQITIIDNDTKTETRWQFTADELLTVAVAIFEKVIPIIRQEKEDKDPNYIPF